MLRFTILHRITMACFFSLCCLSLNAQTFFVSTTGDDNASGSRENPLATITEAVTGYVNCVNNNC